MNSTKQSLESQISQAVSRIRQDILQAIRKNEQRASFQTQITSIKQPLERPQCDSDWKGFDGNCYYIVTTKKAWTDARAACKLKNSDLVIINSEREQNFLSSITDMSDFWIGLKGNTDKNEWRWVDGTIHKLSEGFWLKGEPNNSGGQEDCVHMRVQKKWNDIVCSNQYKAICEKN
ncbi:hepatic lectin-like [Xenopus tropicalis]|uniref:Hepatic lectin-like n=1 Tax=Xenopus tropicalis TaxID=8364 RepID=A0A803JVW4_XENTR|nr:hepatic lectin-like [Xenopus tropicalis]|eukprot:XP_017948241.1 PREDICTED: hepatic lectin-like [Xenopus tropicalis]